MSRRWQAGDRGGKLHWVRGLVGRRSLLGCCWYSYEQKARERATEYIVNRLADMRIPLHSVQPGARQWMGSYHETCSATRCHRYHAF